MHVDIKPLYRVHEMPVIDMLALTAAGIRHHQMNHEEGGVKRGWGFQEAIWQLSELLVLKHEKTLYGKEFWRWSVTSTHLQPVITSLTVLPFLKVCWASRTFLGLLFLLKRVPAFHCILKQPSTVVATQSSIIDVRAATSTAHSFTDPYSSVLTKQGRDKAQFFSLSSDAQAAVIWKLLF